HRRPRHLAPWGGMRELVGSLGLLSRGPGAPVYTPRAGGQTWALPSPGAAIHLRDRRRLLYDHTLPNHTSRIMRAALPLLLVVPLVAVPAPAQLTRAPATEVAVFAGGCFWGVDAVFKHVRGVVRVVSGYSGGSAATAHYGQVSTHTTGHAESVEVT